ncbi:uncharacterized protein [Henckelia pumila]|uniref:uncharacterized protein n=1 Tax=Henckelia pumila TaxID=405737 RepID=UPI003C6E4B4A
MTRSSTTLVTLLILLASCHTLFSNVDELGPNQKSKREWLRIHNKVRIEHKVPPMIWDRDLASSALSIAKEISASGETPYVGGYPPGSRKFINHYYVCGEGGRDYPNEDAMKAWLSGNTRSTTTPLFYLYSVSLGCAKAWGWNTLCSEFRGSHSVVSVCLYLWNS